MPTTETYRRACTGAAGRQIRQARRTAGRMLVSAIGFGLAYYFDTENGSARRARLAETVRHVVHDFRAGAGGELEAPPATLSPTQRALRAHTLRARAERLEAVR